MLTFPGVCAATPQHRDNGGIPANVFTMNLADRIKLSKGIRKLPPAAYTMSGAPPASACSALLLHLRGAFEMQRIQQQYVLLAR